MKHDAPDLRGANDLRGATDLPSSAELQGELRPRSRVPEPRTTESEVPDAHLAKPRARGSRATDATASAAGGSPGRAPRPGATLHALRALDRALLDLAAERARLAAELDPALLATTVAPDRVADLGARGDGRLAPADVAALLDALHRACTRGRDNDPDARENGAPRRRTDLAVGEVSR